MYSRCRACFFRIFNVVRVAQAVVMPKSEVDTVLPTMYLLKFIMGVLGQHIPFYPQGWGTLSILYGMQEKPQTGFSHRCHVCFARGKNDLNWMWFNFCTIVFCHRDMVHFLFYLNTRVPGVYPRLQLLSNCYGVQEVCHPRAGVLCFHWVPTLSYALLTEWRNPKYGHVYCCENVVQCRR